MAKVKPPASVAIRHTVGLLDAIRGADGVEGEIDRAALSLFKAKIGGDVETDLSRLRALAQLLDERVPDSRVTLDANEQYDSERLGELLGAFADKDLRTFRDRLLYIEQPFDRARTFAAPLPRMADAVPFIIDEADGDYDAFPRAVALGYRGVSSKSCKGYFKSLLNGARVAALNAGESERYFVSAEDLTCQAGLGIQQDTALVAALGLAHAERNGHHYVDGFGPATEAEAAAFADAHPALYDRQAGRLGLAVARGFLPTASLFEGKGFASGAEPQWGSLEPLTTATAFKEIVA
jgi:L-alanine-DL-glutamate epimerase-like enolase superfamily enzyme